MKNENMGWECPKCSRCYAPTVQECSNCIPKPNDDTAYPGSIVAYTANTGGYQYAASSIMNTMSTNHNSTSNASRACINFVEVKGNKYCGNCNRPRANHASSSYT